MTTVAYKDGILASDSACSDDWQFLSGRVVKICRLKSGCLMGSSGDADVRMVEALLNKVKTIPQLPSKKEIEATETDFSAILVLPKGNVFHIYCDLMDAGSAAIWHGGLYEVGERMFAVGSGSIHAMAALKLGKSACEAVALACTLDFFSRPPIHSIPLLAPPKSPIKKTGGK